MLRQDLLALTLDDLTTLSNRGLVQRAIKELESAQLSYQLQEDNTGTVTIQWSDAVECVLPAKSTLSQSCCSCAATTLCRHLLRSVLAYQQAVNLHQATDRSEDGSKNTSKDTSENPTSCPEQPAEQRVELPSGQPSEFTALYPEPESQSLEIKETDSSTQGSAHCSSWNPGEITDAELAQYYRKTEFNRLQKLFHTGHVIELIKQNKPVAQFHSLPYTVRFLVPNDIRYTHCNCAEPVPCGHVLLAVWGFRCLPADQPSGIVDTSTAVLSIPTALLDDLEHTLIDLVQTGLANCSAALVGRWQRLEAQCRAEGLVWPAEILTELLTERDRYLEHDARFSPSQVAELIGELCIRLDAIRSNTGAVPQLFIRGSKTDRVTEIGSGRWIGLGCGVQLQHRSFKFRAYLQDIDSGTLAALCRDFPNANLPNTTDEPPQSFATLGRTQVKQGMTWSGLGSGQLLTQGGKLTPSHELILSRTKAILNPQTYHWETLRPPLLVEDFAELQAHLQTLPPACLRSRHLTEHFYVCRVKAVDDVRFDQVDHAVMATLTDGQGGQMILNHPYTFRGRAGVEELFTSLQTLPGDGLKFVAGQVVLKAQGLVIYPVSLVIEPGKTRTLLQPWLDQNLQNLQSVSSTIQPDQLESFMAQLSSPLTPILSASLNNLAELLITGLHQVNPITLQSWKELRQLGERLGFYRFAQPIDQLIEQLENRRHDLNWQGDLAAQNILEIAVLTRLTQDLSIRFP
ncbi:MAG: hypothetical protein ACRC8A_07145 [Microcoleaceae cyanobacterium]